MKVAINYRKGVKVSTCFDKKKSKSKKKYNRNDKLIAEICEKCPYSDCKSGICDYYKEQARLILNGEL